MRIRELCTVDTVYCDRSETVQGAALLMRKYHVGDLIVIDQRDGALQPAGIITDRDIVVSVIALGLDADSLQVGDIMSEELLLAGEDDDIVDTIDTMRQHGVRRMPVIAADGSLCGIVSVDDLLEFLAGEMGQLSRISAHQQQREKNTRQ